MPLSNDLTRRRLLRGAAGLALAASPGPIVAARASLHGGPVNDLTVVLTEAERRNLERYLRNVVAELRLVSSGNPALVGLLDRTTLNLDGRIVKLSPNAFATFDKSKLPVVQIDFALVRDIIDEADLAAALCFASGFAAQAVSKAASDYGARIGVAAQAGQPAPRLAFNIDDTDLPQLEKHMLQDISGIILQTTLAWFVLHEIGHHVLGHVSQSRVTPAQSRADELAADKYGVEALLAVGYSPEPLRRYLVVRMATEQLLRMAGYVFDHGNADHPSWNRRNQQVQTLTAGREVPSFPIQVVQWSSEDATGNVWSSLVAFESDPTVTASLATVNGGEGPGIAAYERQGDIITVFGRSRFGYRQEITIPQTNRFFMELSIRQILPASDTTMRATGYHLNFATRLRALSGTANLTELIAQSHHGAKALNRRLLGPDLGARVDAIQAYTARLVLGSFIDYCKGRISMQDFTARSGVLAEKNYNDIRREIGDRDYPAYRQALDRYVAENVMTEGVLGRLNQMRLHRR